MRKRILLSQNFFLFWRQLLISTWSQRPKLYGTAYFLLIPLFAIVYWQVCPGDFHMDLARAEPIYQSQLIKAKQLLQAQLVSTFRHRHAVSKVPIPDCIGAGPCLLDGESIQVVGTAFRDDEFEFGVSVALDAKDGGFLVSIGLHREPWSTPVAPGLESILAGPFEPDALRFDTYSLLTTGGSSWVDTQRAIGRVIFPHRINREGDNDRVRLPVNTFLRDTLGALYAVREGSVERLPGKLARMFYLSAVTITTLGYGDLVPTTTVSRILVSSEAILGVLLAGLFLNSLTSGREARGGPRGELPANTLQK